MLFRRKKKEKFNILLCVSTVNVGASIREIIPDNPDTPDIQYNFVNEFYYGRPMLDFYRKNKAYIDCVIVDANCEGLDGYDICRELREMDRNAKIILISESKKKLNQSKKLYYLDGILLQPYQPAYMWSRINDIIESIKRGR